MSSINSLRFCGGGGLKDPNIQDPSARLAREKAMARKPQQTSTAPPSSDSTLLSTQTSNEKSPLETATERAAIIRERILGTKRSNSTMNSSTPFQQERPLPHSNSQTQGLTPAWQSPKTLVFKTDQEFYRLQEPSANIPKEAWGKALRIPRWDYKKYNVEKSAISSQDALNTMSDRIRAYESIPVEERLAKRVKFPLRR